MRTVIMSRITLLLLVVVFCGLARAALPVWPESLRNEKNCLVEFSGRFNWSGGKTVLEMAGASIARVKVNERFAAYGPARGPKGFFRKDVWDLTPYLTSGSNEVKIEVAGYNVNSYYLMDISPFLLATVTEEGKPVLETDVQQRTGAFVARQRLDKVRKTCRYSFQRPFSEHWIVPKRRSAALPLVKCEPVSLLARHAPNPTFAMDRSFSPFCRESVAVDHDAQVVHDRSVKDISPLLKGYRLDELEVNFQEDRQRLRFSGRELLGSGAACCVDEKTTVMFKGRVNNSGFPGMRIRVTKPGRFRLWFDELPDRSCDFWNCVGWDVEHPGEYELESFEPYTGRYMRVTAENGGEAEVCAVWMREYKNSAVMDAKVSVADAKLGRIVEAAKESLSQNAVDVFTDCPSRERAGWLCDSYFSARTYFLLTGKTDVERDFLENLALAKSFPGLPEGAMPDCYPADHPNGEFIPNWTMWMVIQLEEYARRSGDRDLVGIFRPRVLAFLKYMNGFRNSEGLLENLPSWVFIEWSHANDLTGGVNYPSNMLWQRTLRCIDALYGMPELTAEAETLRAKIRAQSMDGIWFRDQKGCADRTETCQYYAFYFGVATMETDAKLWQTLVQDFGPWRDVSKTWPAIAPSNAFIGDYLRLELLKVNGAVSQMVKECQGYFLKMADSTGTLWEHDKEMGSCCHGFAAYVIYLLQGAGVEVKRK